MGGAGAHDCWTRGLRTKTAAHRPGHATPIRAITHSLFAAITAVLRLGRFATLSGGRNVWSSLSVRHLVRVGVTKSYGHI